MHRYGWAVIERLQTIGLHGFTWLNIVYWGAVFAAIIIGLLTFLINEIVRKETRDNEKVNELFKQLMNADNKRKIQQIQRSLYVKWREVKQ